ncbi:Cobalt transport protein CbiQ [Candidatus Terasakiella magnetica]|nr:Cobalt transport protein CbiQ [Candidatus Terasakiella magnetica]
MAITIDRLAQASPWRKRAVLEKAALALGLLAVALVVPPWPGALLVLAVTWGLALGLAGISWREWGGLNAAPMGFILTGAVALAVEWGADGPTLAADHGAAALAVVLRASASVSCLLLLAATTPTPDVVAGLRRLGLSSEIADLALLTWRFLFLLQDGAAAIRIAQDSRLGWLGWRRSIHSLGLLIAMLLPRAMERARRLEIGLAARGYDGTLPVLHRAAPASLRVLAAVAVLDLAVAGVSLWLS